MKKEFRKADIIITLLGVGLAVLLCIDIGTRWYMINRWDNSSDYLQYILESEQHNVVEIREESTMNLTVHEINAYYNYINAFSLKTSINGYGAKIKGIVAYIDSDCNYIVLKDLETEEYIKIDMGKLIDNGVYWKLNDISMPICNTVLRFMRRIVIGDTITITVDMLLDSQREQNEAMSLRAYEISIESMMETMECKTEKELFDKLGYVINEEEESMSTSTENMVDEQETGDN